MAQQITTKTIRNNKRTLRSRIKSALDVLRDQALSNQDNSYYNNVTIIEGQPLQVSRRFKDYAAEGYAGNVWAYRSARKIVDTAADIDWLVKRNVSGPEGGEQEDVEHTPLNDRWTHPNPSSQNQTQHDFIENILLDLLIGEGHAFIHLAEPNHELNVLRPDLVKIIPGPRRSVRGYEYTVDEAKNIVEKYKAEEVLHINLIDPSNEFGGVSPAHAAARSIDLNNHARLWNDAKIQNTTGLSHVFLTGDVPFTENQIAQVKETIDDQYRGPSNAGKMAVVEANSIEPLSNTPKDMDWIGVMELSAIEITVAFGVPYVLLHPEGATYENLDHAKRQLFTETVFPLLDKLKDSFNKWLCPLYGDDLELTFDKENVSALQEDVESKAAWVMQLATNRLILVNEAREMLGLETRDDCDLWLEPSQLLATDVNAPLQGEVDTGAALPAITQPLELAPPEPTQVLQMVGELRQKLVRPKKP